MDEWNYDKFLIEVVELQRGNSKYEWDELEELINDAFFDAILDSDQFDELMTMLMDMEL